MAEDVNAGHATVLSRATSRPYTLLGTAFLIVVAFPVFLRQPQDWESVYVPAAARLLEGVDIYQGDFVYPPINAWLALPFVGLPHLPTRAAWYVINLYALAVLLVGAWRLSGGGRLEGLPSVPWYEHAIFWVGVTCGISSCLDAITNQQTDLIVAALVILGCNALLQARNLRAAIWFGVAAGIKCTPLLWAGYLAWRKQWTAAVLVAVIAVGVNLIPDLTHPSKRSATHLGEWTARFLMPMADRDHDFGTWNCGIGGNQSVAGLWHRWLVYDATWQGTDLVGLRSEARVAPATLKVVSWGSMLLLVAAGLACTWKPTGKAPLAPPATGLQFAMVLILMVLLSPHSSKPHFCTLLLPAFCVARAALTGPHRSLVFVLGGAAICSLVANQDLVGSWLYSWTKWYGSLAWCALLLYVGCCKVLLARRGNVMNPADTSQPCESSPVRQAA